MIKIEDYLKELIENKGEYNETEVQQRQKKWHSSLFNVLANIGLEKDVFTEDELHEFAIYITWQNHFDNLESCKEFIAKLKEDLKEKLWELSLFYYFSLKNPNVKDNLNDSFKLIIMTSIIEALMSVHKFMEFDQWMLKECSEKKKNEVKNKSFEKQLKILWKDYKNEYGAHKKFKTFFYYYLPKEEQDILIQGFEKLDEDRPPTTIKDVAEWLYTMRSNFVHNAEQVLLPNKEISFLGHKIGKNFLSISSNIDEILSVFEKGFMQYFKSQKVK